MPRRSGVPPTLLVLTQTYLPDPASVGQHMADVAAAMAARGHRTVVLTADRGYDDPSARYPRRERLAGVDVRRLPRSSFGKGSILLRVLGGLSFALQAVWQSIRIGRIERVLVSTSPPLTQVAGLLVSVLRGAPLTLWVMDLNPDQMVALGVLGPRHPVVRAFDWLNRRVLARAEEVIVLDRFMAERVLAKRDVRAKLTVLPPWPHEDHLEPIPRDENPFRREHGLDGKLVVMYSGNHGPSNPLRTVLDAALRLQDDPRFAFVFVGGGIGKAEVDAVAGPTIRSLPYQPLERLRYSLSAADVHLVTIGDAVVGIVHPCKVYGAMAVARPILLVGPEQSHVGDLLAREAIGWRIGHGDVDGLVSLLRSLAGQDPRCLEEMGERARRVLQGGLSKDELCGRLCDLLEQRPATAPRADA
ncbi:MAG TPA: glycosyltransferase family 4 protein [Gemmatimonadales bacterium]